MANLDELFSQIPTQQIANMLGVDAGEVDGVVKTLVPVLVGSLHQNAQDADTAAKIQSAADNHAASGLLDGGVDANQVDQTQGNTEISRIFGGNDTSQVASTLGNAGVGNSDLIRRVLPLLAPIVLAYIGKQLTQKRAAPATAGVPPTQQAAGGGGLADVLGSILGASGGGGGNPLGSILGSVLGGKQGGALGDVLGSLLGNK